MKNVYHLFFSNMADFCILENVYKFFDSCSYFIAFMYTIVAQKVAQCLRKYKTPDKRSENLINHSVCLIIPSIPQFIDEKVNLSIFHGKHGA